MKRDEKNAQSRRRIMDAALKEFSTMGYERASLNNVCTENGLSKGLIYHYFTDRNDIYLACVAECFDSLTSYMKRAVGKLSGTIEEQLRGYFDARLRFFENNKIFAGIFKGVIFDAPSSLSEKISEKRKAFDDLNISVLSGLLKKEHLRSNISVESAVSDFRVYMDYFNMKFKNAADDGRSFSDELKAHEAACHRQIYILLHGVLDNKQ